MELSVKLKPIHRTLDKWFGLYVRKRGMTRHDGTHGNCCTCGRTICFDESDCGHFISRDRIATRWDERNAHAQCRNCNRFRSGEQYAHGLYIANRYGQSVLDELRWKSQHPIHYTDAEIKTMTDFFRNAYKALL